MSSPLLLGRLGGHGLGGIEEDGHPHPPGEAAVGRDHGMGCFAVVRGWGGYLAGRTRWSGGKPWDPWLMKPCLQGA